MKNKYLLHVLIFSYFAASSVMFPYLTIYFSRTLTAYQIGILMAIIPTSMLLLQPFWGWAADRWGIRKVLMIALTFTMLSAIGFLYVKSFIGFFAVLTTYAIFVASISSLIDSLVLTVNSSKYGSIRLWGSIGYAIGVFTSSLFKNTLIGFWSFVVHICILFITLIIIIKVPNKNNVKTACKIEEVKITERFSFLKDSKYIVLLFSFFLIGIVIKGYDNFYPVGLNNFKISGLLMGTSWILQIIPEICMFYLLDKIVGRVSTWKIVITGTILYGIRMALIGLYPVLWVWIASQPISGFAFSFWYFGAVKIIKDMVSESQQSTGQALFWSFCYGAGGLIGSFLSGYIVDKTGIAPFFQIAAVLCIISTIIVVVLSKSVCFVHNSQKKSTKNLQYML